MDHVSLSDPMTWVVVLVAALLIAGLRWLMRGRAGRSDPPRDKEPGA